MLSSKMKNMQLNNKLLKWELKLLYAGGNVNNSNCRYSWENSWDDLKQTKTPYFHWYPTIKNCKGIRIC